MEARPTFREQIQSNWAADKRVCLELNSEFDRLPHSLTNRQYANFHHDLRFSPQTTFNHAIVNATADLLCAIKINPICYADNAEGERVLENTTWYIHQYYPDIPIIGDVTNSNKGAAQMAFDRFGFDAVTVHPYLGHDTLAPFLAYPGKGLFVLCNTTNPDSREFQQMPIDIESCLHSGLLTSDEYEMLVNLTGQREKLDYRSATLSEMVAFLAAKRWDRWGNIGLVVEATHPETFALTRRLAPTLPFLIPITDPQDSNLKNILKFAADHYNEGIIISSANLIYTSFGTDFADAARDATLTLHEEIIRLRQPSAARQSPLL